MRLKAAFIDIDNTLLDFDAYVRQTMEKGFARFGLCPYAPWMYHVFTRENNALWRRIEAVTLTFPELEKIRWNTVFAALGIQGDGPAFEAYFRKELHESAIPVPGAMDLLRELRGKCILCVASNGPEEQQLHRLRLSGMDDFFDDFFISQGLGASKPSKDFYARAFARLNAGRRLPILPEETVMIGDSLTSDMAGGLGYGMAVCLFRRDPGQEVPACIPLAADRLTDIPPMLENFFGFSPPA